jgi:hypothetical protein
MFRYHKPGTPFECRELAVTAGQDVAFVVAMMCFGRTPPAIRRTATGSCSG